MVKEGKTVAEEQKAKYEIIYDMGTELYIAKVQLAELKEQDINARIMKNEMQDQLTANIKNRGQLESLPLIALMGEKLEIISGHHRVKSAREAGLKEIIVKSITKPGDFEQIQWGVKIPEEFQNEVLKDYMKILASGGVV